MALAGVGALLPVIHVVLLQDARRAEGAQAAATDRILHLLRRVPVSEHPSPYLRMEGAPRLPQPEGVGGGPHQPQVGKHVGHDGLARLNPRPQTRLHIGTHPRLVVLDQSIGWVRRVIGMDHLHTMPVLKRHLPAPEFLPANTRPLSYPYPEGRDVSPTEMVPVPNKALGRELPVAGHNPLVQAWEHLNAAFVPVEEGIQVPSCLAQVLAKRRRVGVEGGEQQPLVAVQLGHRGQTPLIRVQLAVISLLEAGHGNQLTVGPVGPAMVGAHEAGGVARVGPAYPVPAVATHVQEGVYLAPAVTGHHHRVLTHIGGEEVTRLRYLALVSQEEPALGEDFLHLLLVNLFLDENPLVYQTYISVNQSPNVRGHTNLRHPVLGLYRYSTM